MTPTGPIDRDDQLAELLRLLRSRRARLDDPDVRRAIEQYYGRLDALELLREVAREEQLVRLLRLRTGIGSGAAGEMHCDSEPRVMFMGSTIARTRPSTRVDRWRVAGLAAAAVLLIGIALSLHAASGILGAFRDGGSVESRSVTTRVAQLDTVNLPDGSRVILAPNSHLEFAMTPRTGPREIRLEGEALFDVVHDDGRPFRVRTRRAVVEDLGTSFVVREYLADSRARVAVRSGAAALHASDDPGAVATDLRPGDGAYVDSTGTIARFTGDPESFGAWVAGYLTFDGASLPEVLSQLETWYGVEFRMTDSMLAKQYFSGGLSSASLSDALEILGSIVHARFAKEGRVVAVTARPEGR